MDEIATEWTLKKAVLSGRFWALILFPFLSVVGVYIIIYGFVEAGIGMAGAIGAWVAGFIFDQTKGRQNSISLYETS